VEYVNFIETFGNPMEKKIDNHSHLVFISVLYKQTTMPKTANKVRNGSSAKKGKKSTKGGVAGAVGALANPCKIGIPQWVRIDPRQVPNSAGGFSWRVPDETLLMRFLIMGDNSKSYYAKTGQESISEVADVIFRMMTTDAGFRKMVDMTVEVSVEGRAPKQEPTMIAICSAIVFAHTNEQKAYALEAAKKCMRIPTHLFMFIGYIKSLSQNKAVKGNGFGRGVRNLLCDYYCSRGGRELARLCTKYANREGWTHKDVIRLIHLDPRKLKDDGARLVIEMIMTKDTEAFQAKLKSIPTSSVSQQPHSPPAAVSQPIPIAAKDVKVSFSVVSGPLAGEQLVLVVKDNEPLLNARKQFRELGAGKVSFAYMGNAVSSTTTLKDLAYSSENKIFAREDTTPDVEVKPSEAKSSEAKPEDAWVVIEKQRPAIDQLASTADYLRSVFQMKACEQSKSVETAVSLITKSGLEREHVPTPLFSAIPVWEALLYSGKGMGLEALMRNLGKFSSIGLMGVPKHRDYIVKRLTDASSVQESKLHPLKLLVASKVYSQGTGDLGKLTWRVDGIILTALTTAFKLSFGNVPKSGKRMMIALDVSGSMSTPCAGAKNLSCREGSVAMALVQVAVEGTDNVHVRGFCSTFHNFDGKIRPDMTVQDAINATNVPFGSTDCALPMVKALQDGLKVDVFVVYTDSETYMGSIHPQVALQQYREKTGINAKLVVVGMVGNSLTIVDPADRNTLNLAGFDTATPEIMSLFASGKI
jgi:hypothetical protein